MSQADHQAMLLAAALHRIEKLEARVAMIEAGSRYGCLVDEARLARDVANELKLPGTVFVDRRLHAARRRLATALRAKEMTHRGIAGVLGCTERTIERYFRRKAVS